MTAAGPMDLIVALLLVICRVGAFLLIAPPFASRSIPNRIRVMAALAISLPLVGRGAGDAPGMTSIWPLVTAVIFQILIGLTLGFVVLLAFSAIQAAGEMIDLFSMFAMASMLDPFSNTNSSIFGRIQYLIGTTLLFTSGGHLVMLRGLLTTFEVMPAGTPEFGAVARMMSHDIGRMVLAAFEIAGPVLACLFLADLALGLVSRAVPSLNVFQLSFPVKTLLTVTLASIAVALMPAAVNGLLDGVMQQFPPALDMLGG